jgi:hypothetical protein
LLLSERSWMLGSSDGTCQGGRAWQAAKKQSKGKEVQG